VGGGSSLEEEAKQQKRSFLANFVTTKAKCFLANFVATKECFWLILLQQN
jgi:hypothetical protein